MRNKKRWLAVAIALCMTVPSVTAFADDTKVTGNGALEYDSGKIKDFYNVVLPTVSNSTYGFVLDPTGKLNQYDGTNYASGKTVYFQTVSTAAQLSNGEDAETLTSDQKLYVVEYQDVGNAAAVLSALEDEIQGGAVNSEKDTLTGLKGDVTLAVWVPDTDNLPAGKYVDLTAANIIDYVEVTGLDDLTNDGAGTLKTDNQSGDNIFDGKLYKKVYTDLSTLTYDALDYVTVQNGVINSVKEDTLYTQKADGSDYIAITADNMATYLKYTAPVTTNSDTSDEVKIVNKSSSDTTVTAKVTVQNPGSLKFLSAAPATDDETASIYMTLDATDADGTTTNIAVKSDEAETPVYSAEKTFTLAGANTISDYNVYQGDVNPATGGHFYEYYNKPSMTYEEVSFAITAAANSNTDAADAWKAYAEELEAAYKADESNPKVPKIEVVYDIQGSNVDDETGNGSDVSTEPTDLTGSWGGDGSLWFAIDDNNDAGGFTNKDLLTEASILKKDGTYANVTLDKVTFANNGWASITWKNVSGSGYDFKDGSVTLKLTYDDTEYQLVIEASN